MQVSLVVPIHHRSGSLEPLLRALGDLLDHAPVATEVVLVDDRSPHPDAGRALNEFARRDHVRLLKNDRNRGKGYSVRRGMLQATGEYRVFTDADIAYPLDEVWKMVAALRDGADLAIACRVHPESVYIMTADYLPYIYTRHVMSRAFNRLVRATLISGILDTQAGLKAYTAAAAESVFSRVRIDGFGFDLECLFVARYLGLRIAQMPIVFRYRDEPSTVRFARDAVTMISDLIRIRVRGWTGAYRVGLDPAAHEIGRETSVVA
jgi:dolichyl-phosphate beta-glucosyltransferase